MIEKSSYQFYTKKIIPYLDGSLSADERSEFEAFVLTHPEFEAQIKTKKDEIELIRKMIPKVSLSPAARESLEGELKTSVYNLLKEEPKTLMEGLKMKLEDLLLR